MPCSAARQLAAGRPHDRRRPRRRRRRPGPAIPAKQDQSPPRPRPQSWPETGQDRAELEERLSSPPFPPASAEVRRSMRRGLASLLDWLEQQPGSTWQDRWLASGAEAAGPAWTDLVPSVAVRPAEHVRNDLLTAMRLLLTGQVLRPGYGWLLRYRPSVLLEEARSRIDPAGFARLRVHFGATGRRNPQDLKEALNRITWILLARAAWSATSPSATASSSATRCKSTSARGPTTGPCSIRCWPRPACCPTARRRP